jgi:hypothetical protein
MVKRRALLVLLLATTLAASATTVSAAGPTVNLRARTSALASARVASFDSSSTALRLLRQPFLLAFRLAHGFVLVDIDFPATVNDYGLDGIQDGGDTTDPLGAKDNAIHQQPVLPASATTPVH